MKYIDAHVHITPENAIGRVNPRFQTELCENGYLKKGDMGFYIMPPYIHDSQFSCDTLIHMMDVYGVERAVIQQSLMSEQNEAVAQAVAKYPKRLSGAMVVEPTDDWKEQMEYWSGRGLKHIKFEMRSFTEATCYPDLTYTDPRMMKIFRKAGDLGLTVTIDPAPINFPIYDPDDLYLAIKAVPEVHFIICHLGYPFPFVEDVEKNKWRKMIEIAKLDNCWLDVSAMPDLFDHEGWPYPTALGLLKTVKEAVGAKKLIWGTDASGSLNRATYPQMQMMFYRTDVLSEEERELLFYRNAVEAYKLDPQL